MYGRRQNKQPIPAGLPITQLAHIVRLLGLRSRHFGWISNHEGSTLLKKTQQYLLRGYLLKKALIAFVSPVFFPGHCSCNSAQSGRDFKIPSMTGFAFSAVSFSSNKDCINCKRWLNLFMENSLLAWVPNPHSSIEGFLLFCPNLCLNFRGYCSFFSITPIIIVDEYMLLIPLACRERFLSTNMKCTIFFIKELEALYTANLDQIISDLSSNQFVELGREHVIVYA
jgi:hypothetical protein